MTPAIAEGPSQATNDVPQTRPPASSSKVRTMWRSRGEVSTSSDILQARDAAPLQDETRGMTDVAALNSVLAVQGEQRNQAQAFRRFCQY